VTYTWTCARCGAVATTSTSALPDGWVWQPYLSRHFEGKQPGRIDHALGCSPMQAYLAAKEYGQPVKVVPMEGPPDA
jgi:hypothetical protein